MRLARRKASGQTALSTDIHAAPRGVPVWGQRSLSRFFVALACAAPLFGQFGKGSYTTFGGDAQRTGWNRNEPELNRDSAKNLKLEWSTKLDSVGKGLTNLSAPVVRATIQTTKGVKDYVIVAGGADRLFVLDGDTGKIAWQSKLTLDSAPQRPDTWLCANAINATPAIANLTGKGLTVFALGADGRLHGFNLITGEQVLPPTPFTPPYAKTWSLNISRGIVYTTTSQGCGGAKSAVYAMELSDDKANDKADDKPDAKRTVASFAFGPDGGGAGVWGRGGVALTADGRIVVETGDGLYDPTKGLLADSVAVLAAPMGGNALKLADYYTPANRVWIERKDLDLGNMTPTVFPFKSWELIAAAGKEGTIYLLDAKSLGGADHQTPLYRSPLFSNEEANFAGKGFWGAFTTWEDNGTRWLYAPSWGPPAPAAKFAIRNGDTPHGSLMAFKVAEANGKPSLTPVWNSVDMSLPTPAIVANGAVFVLSDGDNADQFTEPGTLLNVEQRKARTGHAVLYALDAATGKTLYSSGDTITSFSHFAGIAAGGGRVYVTTFDGSVYAFGLGAGPLP